MPLGLGTQTGEKQRQLNSFEPITTGQAVLRSFEPMDSSAIVPGAQDIDTEQMPVNPLTVNKQLAKQYLRLLDDPHYQEALLRSSTLPVDQAYDKVIGERKRLLESAIKGEFDTFEPPGTAENLAQKFIRGVTVGAPASSPFTAALSAFGAIGYEPQAVKVQMIERLVEEDPAFAEIFAGEIPSREPGMVESMLGGVLEIAPQIASFRQAGRAVAETLPVIRSMSSVVVEPVAQTLPVIRSMPGVVGQAVLTGKEAARALAHNLVTAIPRGAATFLGQSILTGQGGPAPVTGAAFETANTITGAIERSLPSKFKTIRYIAPLARAFLSGTAFAGGSAAGAALMGEDQPNLFEEFGKGVLLSLYHSAADKVIRRINEKDPTLRTPTDEVILENAKRLKAARTDEEIADLTGQQKPPSKPAPPKQPGPPPPIVRTPGEVGLEPGVSGKFITEEEFKQQAEEQRLDRAQQRIKEQKRQFQREKEIKAAPLSTFEPVENIPEEPEDIQQVREELLQAGVPADQIVRMREPELREKYREVAKIPEPPEPEAPAKRAPIREQELGEEYSGAAFEVAPGPIPAGPERGIIPTTEETAKSIPELKSSNEAIGFGRTATPEQVELLATRRRQNLANVERFRRMGKRQESINSATKAQFDREAIEAARPPAETVYTETAGRLMRETRSRDFNPKEFVRRHGNIQQVRDAALFALERDTRVSPQIKSKYRAVLKEAESYPGLKPAETVGKELGVTAEKAELLRAELPGGGYITSSTDLNALKGKYGEFRVAVKDARGHRAVMSVSDFQKLAKHPEFTDRIREVFLPDGKLNPVEKPHPQEGFMGALFEERPMKELLAEKVGISAKMRPIQIEGVTISTESTISNIQQQKFVDVLSDKQIQKLLTDFGITKVTVKKPGTLSLSEEANFSKKTKEISINADAADIRGSLQHEFGHAAYENATPEQQAALRDAVRGKKNLGYPQAETDNILIERIAENYYRGAELNRLVFQTKLAAETVGKGKGVEAFPRGEIDALTKIRDSIQEQIVKLHPDEYTRYTVRRRNPVQEPGNLLDLFKDTSKEIQSQVRELVSRYHQIASDIAAVAELRANPQEVLSRWLTEGETVVKPPAGVKSPAETVGKGEVRVTEQSTAGGALRLKSETGIADYNLTRDEWAVHTDAGRSFVKTETEARRLLGERQVLSEVQKKSPPPAKTVVRPPAEEKESESPDESANNLIESVYERIKSGGSIHNNAQLTELADKAFGGSKAMGLYTSKDAYDALEAGVNKYLLENIDRLMKMEPREALSELRELLKKLPRQAARTDEQTKLQQFSTPPTEAFVAAIALAIKPDDVVLEPSAGVGGLAIFPKAMGAEVHVNEISERRNQLLRALGFENITDVDAENINDLLPDQIKPTAILMNPPFSSTGGRVAKNRTVFGAKHVEQALQRLSENGRLVSIVGAGMAMDKPGFREWWSRIMNTYNVRANIGIPGEEYARYGTTFGNQIIVIDKNGPTPGTNAVKQVNNIVKGNASSLEDALDLLKGIANDRPEIRRIPLAGITAEGERRPRSEGVKPSVRGGDIRAPRREPGVFPSEGAGPVEGAGTLQPSSTGGELGGVVEGGPVQGSAGPSEDVRQSVNLTDAGLSTANEITKRETRGGGTFVQYKPVKLKGGAVHPADIVEAASMAAIDPPDIKYTPQLDPGLIKAGLISDVQLETVVYAGQRHQQILPDGSRAGYFTGDGTGVGKGREVAAIILDNWNQGRQRAVWVSVSSDLREDAQRDFNDLNAQEIPLQLINDYPADGSIDLPAGVIFTTYSSLISQAKTGNKQKRLDQLAKWLGEDGVIIFDEAHKAKNAIPAGMSEPTQTGQAVIDLQQVALPKARIVYASATGATDVRNMAYMTRLGLWGEGTQFPTFTSIMSDIEGGGVGAMEMVARDMKAVGMYNSRNISYEGVDYREVIHTLTPSQRQMYNTSAKVWQIVFKNFEDAIEVTNGGGRERGSARRAFWGAHQRFFKQFITALKVPSVITETERVLKEDKSVVISLIGTGESRTAEKVAKAIAEGNDLEDLDFTPREILVNLVTRSFPTQAYQTATDPNTGQTVKIPLKDKDGNPVESKAAVEAREKTLESLSDIVLPENPLDQIINHFGPSKVAEMTGRKRRLLKDPHTGKLTYKKRAPEGVAMSRINLHENEQFQDGKKHIAIISDAASMGISLHAGNREKNKQRRVQITLELGWSADKQLQTFGRTHRSDQVMPPEYVLLSTDIGGEKRFSATIARRLEALGALTKGQRDATSGGDLAKYNFETVEGRAALTVLYDRFLSGREIPGLDDPRQALRDIGILEDKGSGERIAPNDLQDIPKFLNRVLALDIGRQNAVFDYFAKIFDGAVRFAKETGAFDDGVTDIKAESVRLKDESTVYEHELSGAETRHYELEVDRKTNPAPFEKIPTQKLQQDEGFYQQEKSGFIIYVTRSADHTDPASGRVIRTYHRTTPKDWDAGKINEEELEEKYEQIEPADAKEWWDEQYKKAPKIRSEEVHIIGGVILPIWRKLKTGEGRLKIQRLVTDEGQRIVGVRVPNESVGGVLATLGIAKRMTGMGPEEIFRAVLVQGAKIELEGGRQFPMSLGKRKFGGENAIEVLGVGSDEFERMRTIGLINEKIEHRERFFVPTEEATGIEVLKKLFKYHPPQVGGQSESGGSDISFGIGLGTPLTEAARLIGRFFSTGKTELPLEGISVPDAEIIDTFKKIQRTGSRALKALSVPMWLGEKFPGFRDIWGGIDRIAVREYNENVQNVVIDILNSWKDAERLSDSEKANIIEAIKTLNETNPVDYELPPSQLRERFNLDPAALRVYQQIDSALKAGLQQRKELDKYKIKKGDYSPTPTDLKKYVKADVMEALGVESDEIDAIMTVLRQPRGKITAAQIRALWQVPYIKEIVADGLVNAKFKLLFNYFPLTRPSDHKYAVIAEDPNTLEREEGEIERRPPYFATFGSRAEAIKHAQEIKRRGFQPVEGRGEILVINFEKEFPERLGKRFAEAQLFDLVEAAGVDSDNPVVQRLAKELRSRGFDKHFIERLRAPGFQWTWENVEKNVTEYVDASFRKYAKYVANREAQEILANVRGSIPSEVASYIEQYLESFQSANPQEWALARQIIYSTTLGFSIAHFLQNLTQPIQTSWSEVALLLSEVGVAKPGVTEAIWTRGYGRALSFMAWKAGKMTDVEFKVAMPEGWLDFIEKARRQQVVSPLQIEQLAGLIHDPKLRYPRGGKVVRGIKRTWQLFTDLSSVTGKVSEYINRYPTFFMMLEVGSEHYGLRGKELYEFAVKGVERTQFAYGQHNLPTAVTGYSGTPPARFVRRSAKLAYILQSFSANWLGRSGNLLRRGKWSAIWRHFGATIGLSGLRGLPFMALAYALTNFVLGLLGDEEDIETKERRFYGAAEKKLGLPQRTFSTGIGGLAGVETSRMLGMGDLPPATADPSRFLAPVSLLSQTLTQGLPAIARGEIAYGAERTLGVPRGLRDYLRGRRVEKEGVITSGGFQTLGPEELSGSDIYKLKMGLKPTKVAQAQEESRAQAGVGRLGRMKYADLRLDYVRALARGDDKRQEEIVDEILDFNAKVSPENQINLRDFFADAAKRSAGVSTGKKKLPKRLEIEQIYE